MKNQLEVIVKESGLVENKAKEILDQFSNYFQIADDWKEKAKTIRVKSAEDTADMALARTGRLFLREKRIAIEKTRKNLKDEYLRGGRIVDNISNILKDLIAPTENYLKE